MIITIKIIMVVVVPSVMRLVRPPKATVGAKQAKYRNSIADSVFFLLPFIKMMIMMVMMVIMMMMVVMMMVMMMMMMMIPFTTPSVQSDKYSDLDHRRFISATIPAPGCHPTSSDVGWPSCLRFFGVVVVLVFVVAVL